MLPTVDIPCSSRHGDTRSTGGGTYGGGGGSRVGPGTKSLFPPEGPRGSTERTVVCGVNRLPDGTS